MKKHAILFSGGVNYTNNFSRYKNDLEFAYRVLIEDCGFRKEDTLVFMVSNHGGDDKGGTICCWGEGCRVSLSEVVDILNTIKAKKIVLLGQCYAGNILDYEIENSCVITANIQTVK